MHAAVLIFTAIGLVITAGLTAAGGGVYDAVTESDGIATLDVPVLDWAIGHRGATITPLVNGFTQVVVCLLNRLLFSRVWVRGSPGRRRRDTGSYLDRGERSEVRAQARLNGDLLKDTPRGGPIGMPIIAGLLTVIMVIACRSRTPLILMVIGVAGSLTITAVGKVALGRSRPPLVDAVPP